LFIDSGTYEAGLTTMYVVAHICTLYRLHKLHNSLG